eukprot:CAMPEP_0167815074 /NCGR_PEP_ID=MMETSP0112_2-20121227/2799_1 /TAXON_ID=91324 /ORGANISM="Lotharella globosa, Strain CCCM811" /LENGTH=296 /DNA_ID=CAMNT_0007714411 /DNA_START=75 /DNA_END=965 /DNA_ORIENTATION=+
MLSKSTGSLPSGILRRPLTDTRIHPSKFSEPSSDFVTFNPPPCRFSYSSLGKQVSQTNRTSAVYSLYERRPRLELSTTTPAAIYDCFESGMKRDGKLNVHGPRYYPEFLQFKKDPIYKSRTSIFDECGNSSNPVLAPGRYEDERAFRKSTKRIQEPIYSWSRKQGIKVCKPLPGLRVVPGEKMCVEYSMTRPIRNVRVTLWRAKKIVQVFAQSLDALQCQKVLKKDLIPGLYRFKVEDVSDSSRFAWSNPFQIETRNLSRRTMARMPVFTTFGSQFDSNKRSQKGSTFGWKRDVLE